MITRKRTSTLMLLVSVIVLMAQAREKTRINEDWKFILSDNQQFSQPAFNDSTWRVLDLPHDWSIEGKYDKSNPSGPMGGFLPCGTGWYRKHFKLSDKDKGKRFYICFDGVYMKSQVWINGRMVGEYPNGYNSFQYDITAFVKFDQDNVLAVRVDNSLQPGSRWYSGSGINRNVYLQTTDQLHFEDDATFITTPKIDQNTATLEIEYNIICNNYPETRFLWTEITDNNIWPRKGTNANEGQPEETETTKRVQKNCVLTSILYDSQGKEVMRSVSSSIIRDFSEVELSQKMEITMPKLWSLETPNLYKLVSTISYDGIVRDSIVNTVGFRTFAYSAENGMTLNGKSMKIQGVCIHGSSGALGTAVPEVVWRDRLQKLKDMGCNAIRSHYPLAPEFQYLCDSLGMLVSKEVFDEWNRGYEWGFSENSYGKQPYTYHLYFDQWAETDLRRMIRRDRNHPSVFMYILGNEIPNQRIKGVDIAKKLYAIVKEEDPTRPITAACEQFKAAIKTGFMDVMDFAGYNYIDNNYPEKLYAEEQTRTPERILLGTETYHKTRNHISIRDTKSAIGEFVWVGIDYLGEIVWPDYRGWDAGIIDIAGFPKPEYFLRKSYWSEKPVVHIAVEQSAGRDFSWRIGDVDDHWNWAHKGKDLLPVYVYSNCDEVELFVNNKSLGRKKVGKDDYFALWETSFKPGTVRAVGFINNKKVAEHLLKTATEPSEIKVDRILRSNDLIQIDISVVDKNGIRIPNFIQNVTLSDFRNAHSLGVDNGTQFDPKAIKYSSKLEGEMFQGRMVIYVKKENNILPASFVLKTEGLKEIPVNME